MITGQIGDSLVAVDEQAVAMSEIKDATLNVNGSIQQNALVVGQTTSLAKEL